MALKCPNKNSKLYKKLSLQLSQRNVDNIFAKITTEEFDQWYGDKARDKDGLPIINNYFEITNDKGQRGSLLSKTIKLESTEEVKKLLSAQSTKGIHLFNGRYYVSKDTKEFGERMVKTLNYYYPGLLDRTSYFTASEAIGVSDPGTPTTVLVINDIFNKEGRLFYSPYKIEEVLPEEEKSDMAYLLNRLDEYKDRIHDELRDAEREAKQNKDYSKVEKLKNKQEELDKAISELKLNNSVDNLSNLAKINLDYVENLFNNKDKISVTELNEINDIISFYEYIDSTEKDKHPMSFLNDSDLEKTLVIKKDINGEDIVEMDYLESTKKIQNIAQNARNLRQTYNKLVKEVVTKYYNETYDKNKSIEDLFENIKDISTAEKLTRDAASVGNSLLSLLHSINNDASRVANQKTLEDQNSREEAYKNFENSSLFKSLGKDKAMRLFWQVDEKGTPTGGLINRYSVKYWKDRNKIFSKLYSDSLSDINSAKLEYANTHEFVNYFETEEEKEIEKQRLYQLFPNENERIDDIIEEMDVDFAEFRDRREDAFAEIDALNLEKSKKEYKKQLWDLKNDPRESITNIRNGKTKTDSFGNIIKFNAQFVRALPLKVTKDGKNTNFYDTSFETIEKDKAAYEYYKYVKSTIKTLLSYYPQSYLDSKKLHEGFIPVLKKDLLQQFVQDGMGLSLSSIEETTRRWYGVKTYSKTYDHLDPSTGVVRDSLNIRMLSPNYKTVEGGQIISTENVITDLNEVLNQFIPVTNLYRYKAKLEASHNMVVNAIDQMQGIQKSPTGVDLLAGKNEIVKDNLKNLKELAEFTNKVFYEKQEKEIAGKKKILSKQEKKDQELLEKRKLEIFNRLVSESTTLTEEEETKLNNEIESIDRKLSDLGYNLSATKGLKSILKYFQLVSQGWNFSSASIELIYGFASNNMHASGKRDYNTKQIGTAYKIAVAATMPGVNTNTAKKFNKLIEKFDVIGEVAEIETKRVNNSKKSKFSAKRALAPYELMRNADKVSKGSVMVAMLMNTNLNGDTLQEGEVSLWEAFDENGNIKDEYRLPEHSKMWEDIDANKSLRLATKIAQVNKRNHGNYDQNSAILANSTALGKALLQFRRWMLEGFATRFEDKRYNDNLERFVKGRYRTYVTLASELGATKTTSIMFKSLLHNFAFQNISDEQLIESGVVGAEFSEVDLENIRKNASGLKWLIVVYSMLLMIKAGLDDEDKENLSVTNFLLNQGGRLQQDLNFYANPSTMGDITKNIVPAFKLADKATSWFEAAKNTILGLDPEYSTVYEKGDFKGHSKLLIKSGEMLPGTSTLIRTMRTASKLY